MGISTHVLDTSKGRPAAGVAVTLEFDRGGFDVVCLGKTDADGRLRLIDGAPEPGTYRITFDTGAYFGGETFFPEASITFTVRDGSQHYHVPLLVSPYGYSTYRGS
jgi:5-hydroxyisourate hydrolase